MEILKKFYHFINYWYLRYLLATELYMVETWEKITIHVFIAVIFALFWYFNYLVIVSGISQLRGHNPNLETILQSP